MNMHAFFVRLIAFATFAGATANVSAQAVLPQSAAPPQGAPVKAAAAAPAAIVPESIPPQVDATFAIWDVDHDKALSLQEFRNGWLQLRQRVEIDQRMQRQFHAMDANRDGALDAGEYANLLLVKSAGKSAPPLSTFDANKDRKLNYAEYADLVNRLARAPRAQGGTK